MFKKRSFIGLLAVVNVILVIALVLSAHSLPNAVAQGMGRGGSYLTATAKAAGQSYETLFLLDVTGKKLFAFYPSPAQRGHWVSSPPRDLHADFQGP